MRFPPFLSLVFVCGAALPVVAHAQAPAPAPSGTVVRYDAAFFKQFQVNSAYDMVLRVPGFVFDPGDSARGFSGTAGNVLIDGQRPASKTDLGTTLSNINAAQVDYVELITGGAPGIDMHGQRQIVNVVRKADARPSLSVMGIWRNMGGFDDKGVVLVSFNSNRNGRSTDITADAFTFFDNGVARAHRVVRHANGAVEALDIPQHAGGAGVESQASHSRPLWGGKLSLNGSYNPSRYTQHSVFKGTDTATETFTDVDIPSEIGMQFERKFSHGLGIDLNLLRRHERDRTADNYIDSSGPADFHALTLTDEHILAGRLSWEKRDGLKFSLGTEQALNSRDEVSSYTAPGGSPSNDQVRVQEDRTESFATANWQATPKLGFEAEVKVENSTISVPQDHRADSFVYYKPRFQAVYALDSLTKLSWKAVRQVDQLSFSSFASSVELQSSKVTLGNTALVPQKMWLNTLILERSFWDKGALTLAYEHYEAEDTSDYIAVFDGPKVYTASGNIGRSKWDYLKLKLDLPLDRLHVKGGLLSVDWTDRQTVVKDPVTGGERRISGVEPHKYVVDFSQDFPARRTSWGVHAESLNNDRNYLANELSNSHYNPWTQVWFQYKTPQKLQLRVTLKNPLGLRYSNDRVVYQGLRGLTPVSFTQHQTSKIPPILEVKLKKDL
jgi:hypothetical protein